MNEKPIDTLSRVTGLSKPDMDAIFQAVKANQKLLESCSRHDFSIPLDRRTKQPVPERKAFCDWRCSKCGGWVDGLAKRWYEHGLADASRS